MENDIFLIPFYRNFIRLGVGHLVTTTCKDVCGKYSGDEGGFSGVADQIADAGKVFPRQLFRVNIQEILIIALRRSERFYSMCLTNSDVSAVF